MGMAQSIAVMERPAIDTAAETVLDETSDTARCEDCAHLPGCFCPHACTPRGTE